MSQVDSSSDIQLVQFPHHNHPLLWETVESHRKTHHEGKKIKPHIYYCNRCNTIIIMPPWYTSYFMPDNKIDFSVLNFLQKNIGCCKTPLIFVLLREQHLSPAQKKVGITFVPWKPTQIMIVPDMWVTTTIVSERILGE